MTVALLSNASPLLRLYAGADLLAGPRSQGLARRALGVLQGFIRPLPSLRPEPLPSLPPRRSPRRPTPSPLTANRDGTSGVQRVRDRVQRAPGSRSSNRSFPPRRSWIRHANNFFPWDSPNHLGNTPTRPNDTGNVASVAVEEQAGSPAAPRDTTAGPPSQSSGMFIDRNTIRRPVSPTPVGRGGRTQDTSRNITAASVQGSFERGASPPTVIEHPGDGPLVGAGPDGDRRNAIPPWQWIPDDNENYQAFVRDDRDRINRGDTARLAAYRALNAILDMDAGEAIMMDIYQLLRVRYEWGLTHNYQFPQNVPGYYRPAVPVRTPPMQRYRPFHGGAGTAPGYLNDHRPGRPESDEMYRGASADSSPWFRDSGPDPTLLNRANVPQSWGSWNGGANHGNQDFDLYASCSDGRDQPGSYEQGSQASVDERRQLLRGREIEILMGSRGSVSTLNLPSPSHPAGQHIPPARIFTDDDNGSGPRQGVLGTNDPAGPTNQGGHRTSGGSSFGRRGSPQDWPRDSDHGSPSTPRRTRSRVSQSPSRELFRPQDAGTPTAPERLSFSGVQGIRIGPAGTQTAGQQGSGSRGSGSKGPDDHDEATGSQGSENEGTSTQATPSREQYENMTVRQLQDEIRARGGDPTNYRQRKADLAQALLDYDIAGNYGNGAQPRRRRTAIPAPANLSPRELWPRDTNGKVRQK